ncbi:MAG: enoyl-CoA hydratase/isomerase family protein [Chloroflexi bacterium]|nr:enoyl-CoA hydratase/isomerase family protein [Chloroflexota bacterium]
MTQSKYNTIILEKKGGVFRIILNRPDKMNALNAEMYAELNSALDELESTPTASVLIITGAGSAFCAGGDIGELSQAAASMKAIQNRLRMSHGFALRLRNIKVPTIMAVNGSAVGAGFSLALNGDLLVASESARFGATFIRIGLVPDMGSIFNLVRTIGIRKAFEMAYLADIIDARQAERIGLVNRVVASQELDEVANEWAERLTHSSAVALSHLKQALYQAQELTFKAELEEEINLQSLCLLSDDGKEGLKAFMEKRKPSFGGSAT